MAEFNSKEEIAFAITRKMFARIRARYLEYSEEERKSFIQVLATYKVLSDVARDVHMQIEESKDPEKQLEEGWDGPLTLEDFAALGCDEHGKFTSTGNEDLDDWCKEVGFEWPEQIIGFLNANPHMAADLLKLQDEDNSEQFALMEEDWRKVDELVREHEDIGAASVAFVPLMFGGFKSELGEIGLNGDYFKTKHSNPFNDYLSLCSMMASMWPMEMYASCGGTSNSASYSRLGTNMHRSTIAAGFATLRRLIDTFDTLAPAITDTFDSVREKGIMALAGGSIE